MKLLHDTRAWADAVAELPASGALPCRTVLVFNERTAHALRRELLSTGRGAVLAGTRFLTVAAAAREVLACADVEVRLDPPGRRRARVARAFAAGLSLGYFEAALLRGAAGWDEAFARTLDDLEAAGLRPAALRALAPSAAQDGRSHAAPWLDVATVWEAVDLLAGNAWTAQRIIAEAAARLSQPSVWPHAGPVLATLRGAFTAAEAHFARALPSVEVALFAPRPLREEYLDRVTQLLGSVASRQLRSASVAAPAHTTERDLLARYFLETPERLADPERVRSPGPDGTVQLEEHAGTEAEIEAAADWVARQILEHRTPLDRIAVLVPHAAPLGALVADRIARLGLFSRPDEEPAAVPVLLAGGLSLTASAAGGRMLSIVRALREYLPVPAIAEVLPLLRPADPEAQRLTVGRAHELAFSLGTAGGSASHPSGALDWPVRLRADCARLEAAGPSEQNQGAARRLQDLRNVEPGLTRLCALAQAVMHGANLTVLAASLSELFRVHVKLPLKRGAEPRASELMLVTAALERAAEDPELRELPGDAALASIEALLSSLRLAEGRYGDAAVYVGSIASAEGLPFDAVRVIGLAEGHWPSNPRSDAVLPDDLRRRIAPDVLSVTAERSLSQLHLLQGLIHNTRREIALSFARVDANGSQREPSALFLEAAAALGRPCSSDDRPLVPSVLPHGPVFPDLRVLRRDAFEPARAHRARFLHQWRVSRAAEQWYVALQRQRRAPSGWFGLSALDLQQLRTLTAEGAIRPAEGLLDPTLDLALPGLSEERPISASGLRQLLACPYRFLVERVLGWREPRDLSEASEIDAATYGRMLHKVAEDFFRAFGEPFSAREDTLSHWQSRCGLLADSIFERCLESYPLLGPSVRQSERRRLQTDLDRFLDSEWRAAIPSRLVAAERAFGYEQPVALQVEGAPLFVRGFIDRIDTQADRLVVRDLKTGRAHPRRGDEAGPTLHVDLQLGLYTLVAGQLDEAKLSSTQEVTGAYVYTSSTVDSERAFREDSDALRASAMSWLAVGRALLAARAFPRTTDKNDCTFCAFKTVCGDQFHGRVEATLQAQASSFAVAFVALKRQGRK